MATLSQIKVGNVTYDICDASARNSISSLQNTVSSLSNSVSSLNNSISSLQNNLKDVNIVSGENPGECFHYHTVSKTASISASTTAQVDFSMSVDNYTYLGPIGFNTGGASIYPIGLIRSGIVLRNATASAQTIHPTLTGLYVRKNWLTHT